MRSKTIATMLAAAALTAGTCFSNSVLATPTGINLAPSYPDRPVPVRGADRKSVIDALGRPSSRLAGNGNAEVWDYGTFRVFFMGDVVAFTQVW